MSPALFSIKINNIVNAVLKGTDCSLFVDDFVCEGQVTEQSGKGYETHIEYSHSYKIT